MDRNTLTGLILIGVILIGYSIWMQPSAEEQAEMQRLQDSVASVEQEQAKARAERSATIDTPAQSPEVQEVIADTGITQQMDSIKAMQALARYGIFAKATEGDEEQTTIKNNKVAVTFSNKGGAPVMASLLEYVTYDSLPLLLFDEETSEFNYSIWVDRSTEIYSADLYFQKVESTDSKVVYRLNSAMSEGYIEFAYELAPDAYTMSSAVRVVGLEQVLSASMSLFELQWAIQAPAKERGIENEKNQTTVYYKYRDESADYISPTSFEKESLDATVEWVSFKQQFFSAAIMSDKGFSKEGASIETEELESTEYTKAMRMSVALEFGSELDPTYNYTFYLGPNHFQTLNALDVGLEDQIDLGWAIFGWVNRWLVIPTFNFLDNNTGLSYGIIILVLTLLIKMLLFPLTWKNYISSARMKVLKPEIEELNAKFKDADAMKKQQATMGLYKQAGVNPMAGCLPMLLQLPILYAMFRFFPASIELRQESFLWASDLSTYDSIFNLPFEIPFYGSHVSLFTLLMATSTFFYSKYNMDMAGGAGGGAQLPQMKIMIYMMPVMLLFFFNSYSAGLSYYYFTANVISMIQQFVIKRWFIDEEAIHAKIQANKKRKGTSKKSNFQKRLEKMAKDRGYNPNKK